MFKKLNKKGFTLAELLIVVAIIGVLVAISIPIFTAQLEKAREATDMANIRSAYAVVQAAALTDDTATEIQKNNVAGVVSFTKDGSGDITATVTLKQTQNDWQSTAPQIPGMAAGAQPKGSGEAYVTFTKSTNVTTVTFS